MPLRFTIRDLLWLTVMAGMALGWCVDRRRVANERDAIQFKLYEERFEHGMLQWEMYQHDDYRWKEK
jgi:hypothetical protein